MHAHLQSVLKEAAKLLAGEDLSGTPFSVEEGKLLIHGNPLDDNLVRECGWTIPKLFQPDYDESVLLAAEIEITMALWSRRKSQERREQLRHHLTHKGAEVNPTTLS